MDEPDLSRAARNVVDENGVILYHENLEAGLNGFWVEAKDLQVGDVFLGADGKLSTLSNVVRVEQSGGIAVFNFTVEGNHNYFILAKEYEYGQSCVLVHNGDCQIHHAIPHGRNTQAINHNNSELVKLSGVKLKNHKPNKKSLNGHAGPHSKEYHQQIAERLATAYKALKIKNKAEAEKALDKVIEQIWNDIRDGLLKPYNNKNVHF